MSGFVSYRNLVPWVIASLLAVAAFALMLDAAIAGDSYQAQRKNMIRLIEADVRATSAYLKRSALDERVLDAMARVPRHEFVLTGKCLTTWSPTQVVRALSSGEADYYAALKGASVALGFRSMAADLVEYVKLFLRSDSSAALGIKAVVGLARCST